MKSPGDQDDSPRTETFNLPSGDEMVVNVSIIMLNPFVSFQCEEVRGVVV